ncbi:probable glycosyltransferase At5g25310 [Phoenix dactylifera]|uniref:Probable glycosyltransferase At5g25310 n=1 Tax=Phoenix dactylifera TaxID=42345 RepID=A0A8B9AVJ4_PHODC|nr:probable glycosyltransferase At5g25310 [Phoenix dactylifera]
MECQSFGGWNQALVLLLLSSTAILLFFASDHGDGVGGGVSNPIASLSDLTSSLSLRSPARTPRPLLDQFPRTLHQEPDRLVLQTKKSKERSRRGVEEELARARRAIRRSAAAVSSRGNDSGNVFLGEDVPLAAIYRNPAAFFQSYVEMEKRFKVYVYEEGEPPLVHEGPCKDIYTTEGRFIEELEQQQQEEEGGVRTWDPARAHAFFLPFSVAKMVRYVYKDQSWDQAPIKRFVNDYLRVIASKHPFWNRTAGADHFMLSCHDWGPHASRANQELYRNSIRALCNANTSEGFLPNKDVSIPEIHLHDGNIPRQLLSTPFPDLSDRPYLAFFAGGNHGPIRPLLLHHWKGRHADLPVYEYLPRGLDYYSFMLKSRFCLCPSGHEVASPRIVEAIYAECVPVLISESYALPFADVLRWEAFSVSVPVAEIPRVREVLERVGEEELRRLREGVKAVRRHFVLNHPAKRFDAFNMILHSVWLRRLNVKLD